MPDISYACGKLLQPEMDSVLSQGIWLWVISPSVQLVSSVAQSYLTLCDPMACHTPGFPVHHQLAELAQSHVH